MTSYLYRLCGGWHEEIDANLKQLGVKCDFAETGSGWRWYRVPVEEAKKLPMDGTTTYLPISDELGGYGMYPLRENDPDREQNWQPL